MDLTDAQISKLCLGNTVLAVKQAYYRYPAANYHFLNNCHLQPYNYVASVDEGAGVNNLAPVPSIPRVIYTSRKKFQSMAPVGSTRYLLEGDKSNALLERRDWDRSLFTTDSGSYNPIRPWAPGIMFETVLPFVITLGISDVVIVGWDMDIGYEHGVSVPTDRKYAITQWEYNLVVTGTESYYTWLQNHGIEITLLSGRSVLSSSIPRVTFEEAII